MPPNEGESREKQLTERSLDSTDRPTDRRENQLMSHPRIFIGATSKWYFCSCTRVFRPTTTTTTLLSLVWEDPLKLKCISGCSVLKLWSSSKPSSSADPCEKREILSPRSCSQVVCAILHLVVEVLFRVFPARCYFLSIGSKYGRVRITVRQQISTGSNPFSEKLNVYEAIVLLRFVDSEADFPELPWFPAFCRSA